MGLFNTIGKMTGSKTAKKQEIELTNKQNSDQTIVYCNYIYTNMDRISKMIVELEIDTKELIDQIRTKKSVKLSFKEKGDIRKAKAKASRNLEYLYLIRDFFTALAKNRSGFLLKNEELILVARLAPYFDGVPVLNIEDDDDISVLETFKQVDQEATKVFISSKALKSFCFEDYLYRYSETIEEYTMPNVDSAVQRFNSAMATQEKPNAAVNEAPLVAPESSVENITCNNCHTKLAVNAKFCPECGHKIEEKKPTFCTACGALITPSSKFCSNCGARIN